MAVEETLEVPGPDGLTTLEYVPKFRLDECLDLLQRLEHDIATSHVIRTVSRGEAGTSSGVYEAHVHLTPVMDLERIRVLLMLHGRIHESADTKAGG